MAFPNYFIVGARKWGTTAVFPRLGGDSNKVSRAPCAAHERASLDRDLHAWLPKPGQ